jgi:translocation and assembly module TamB
VSTDLNLGGIGRESVERNQPPRPRHPVRRFLLRALAVLLVLVIVTAGGVYWYSTTPAFENKVRGILISTLEDSVGGRVELGDVRWNLLHLDFEIRNLTIHGLEAANEVPFAHLDLLHVRLKIISLFKAQIGLNYLGVEHPVVHVIVYKDGSTNQPVPRKKSAPSKTSPVDQIFDLAVDRTEINNGVALFNQQAMPFSLNANNLALLVNYIPSRDHYVGNLSIEDIAAQTGKSPLHSNLTVSADAGRNEVTIPSLVLTSGDSSLSANAHLSDFNDPHWQMSAKGSIDLRQAEALAAVPGLDRGVVALDLHGIGTKALFTVDGATRLADVTYKTPTIGISGLSAATKVHITQDEVSLTDLAARLARGGEIDAEAHLYNWLAPSAPQASAPAAAALQPRAKVAATARAPRSVNNTVAANTSNRVTKAQVSRGVVKAHLSGFTLPTILSIIAPPKFQNLGFTTTASGDLNLNWTGNASDLGADAKVALDAPPQPAGGNVPVNGILDAAYSGRDNSVLVRQLRADTPGTHVQVAGGVGLAAGRGSSLQTLVTVSTLGEFNQALIAFGVGSSGKKGTQAIPVALHGQAQFQGTVTGSVAAPDVKGHLSVNNFDVELSPAAPAAAAKPKVVAASTTPVQAPTAPTSGMTTCQPGAPDASGSPVLNCTNPSEQKVPVPVVSPSAGSTGAVASTYNSPPAAAAAAVPPPAPATPAAPSSIHFDSLAADAEYSPALISIESALLIRGKTQLHASGQLHAHQLSRHRLAFDNDSALTADASIAQATIPDLLSLAGQVLPVTGTLALQAHVTGTPNNLKGGGHVVVNGGEAYGQPYKSLNADLVFAGREVGASNLVFLLDGGQLTAAAGFNLTTSQFHFQAQGSGFDLAHFKNINTAPLTVGGQINFDAQGRGSAATGQIPSSLDVKAAAHLVNLAVSNRAGGPTTTGNVDINAHTQAGKVLVDVNSRLNGAALEVHDETALAGEYQTSAKLSLANLDLNPCLQLFNVQGVTAHSALSGTVTLDGPLGTPKQLTGDARLSRLEVITQGFPIATDGGLHAALHNGNFTLDQVHITGNGTDLRADGSAELFGAARALNAKATGSLDLKMVHSLVPDATASGAIGLNMNVGGTIERPDVQGKVSFTNVYASYATFPNGISNMNGSLVFDQGRLSVDNLTGYSGGGLLAFGGFVAYQQGVYADLNVSGKAIRVRYAGGISTLLDTKIRAQGTLQNLLVSGGVTVTRFAIGPNLDLSSFNTNGISPPPDPTAFGNRIRLDIHVTSSPQLDINNSYAKLAGDINLNIRGTAEDPAVLGHISITEGDATFGGTHYVLQHGDIYFTNPVRIDPTIDLEASAHVDNFDVIVGLNGNSEKLTPTFRSEPPLSEPDIFSLLAVGRTQEEASIDSEEQSQEGVNSTADSILGGALNATVTSRINKLFGGGSVKIDPNFVGGTGNSTARITVQQQISKNGTATFATNVNSTADQLIQGQYNLTPDVAIVAVRDESGVFSMLLKLHKRYR